jgi:hypothetical protein
MSFWSSAQPPSRPAPRQRQQWEVAVLTARFPAKAALLVISALLAPGPSEVYAPRSWEPVQRFSTPALQGALLERLRELLREELRQARSLVRTPLPDLCRLERNAPLALHAARLAQLYWELARRPGVRATEEVQRALAALW